MAVLTRRGVKLSAVYDREVSGKTRRRLVDDMRKVAAQIGGDPQSDFEKSFASLAYTYVRDRAPSLMDHLVGFQMVDRNDDGSKAAGLFGFRVGDQWFYVPALFLNGEVKGHELLNLKDQDLFVPLKENWVDFLLQQKPTVLGEGNNTTLQRLGARQPDYESLAFPPLGKFGNYQAPRLHPWVKASGIIHSFAKAVTDPHIIADLCGIKSAEAKALARPQEMTIDKLLRSDVRFVKAAMSLSDRYPVFRSGLEKFYGPNVIRDAVRHLQKEAESLPHDTLRAHPVLQKTTAIGRVKKADKTCRKELTFHTKESVQGSILPYSADIKAKILQHGYAIEDLRKEAATEVKLEDFDTSLVNPSETGVYNILTRPAKFKKCLVIAKPHGAYGRDHFMTIVALDSEDDRSWCNASKSLIYSEPVETVESDKQNWQNWFDGLSDQRSDLAEGGVYVAVSPNGQGTLPFEVSKNLEDGNYTVYFRSYCNFRAHEHYKRHYDGYPVAVPDHQESVDQIRLNDRKGTKMMSVGNTLYLPTDTKIIRLKKPPKPDDSRGSSSCGCSPSAYAPDPPPLQLGALADITLSLQAKTAELKVIQSGGDVFVNDRRMSKMSALFHLVGSYGLREDSALGLLKASEARGGVKTRIKQAAGEGMTPPMYVNQDPSGGMPPPADMGTQMASAGGTPQQMYQEQTVAQQPMYPPEDPYMAGSDPHTPQMQLAQQAQSTGRKELFDTAGITAMLRSVREESMIDRYLDDLIRAVDRWGRILLNFYWHNEEFEDRYGKQDLPELEDTLRNAFEVSGDGVLFLKQKTVKPFGLSNDMMGPDVSSSGSS